MTSPRVFISYSHDSFGHSDRVLRLAWKLRSDGIDVEIDQFHKEEIVDWTRWCNDQISHAISDFVACVCTPEYTRRIEGKVLPERGKGVYWEGSLLDDDLYDGKGNSRLIPILFDEEPQTSIPRFLRGWTHCRLRHFALDDPGYEHLLRILLKRASIEKNELGQIPDLPIKQPLRRATPTVDFGGRNSLNPEPRLATMNPVEQRGLIPPYFPFHCGPWVPPEFFIGRDNELQRAQRLLETRQSFLVVGRPRAGKTSFFRRIINDLSTPTRLAGATKSSATTRPLASSVSRPITSYMNLEQGRELTIERFLEDTILGIIGEMARDLFKCGYSDLIRDEPEKACTNPAQMSEFTRFLNIFRIVYPRTHHTATARNPRLSSADFVQLTKDLLEICTRQGRSQFVVFYDEANRLRRDISVDLLNNIGEALNQTNVIGVYAASPEMANDLAELPGLVGSTIELTRFRSPSEMHQLLARYYFRDGPNERDLPVTNAALEDLWEHSRGFPYALQLISKRMFEIAGEEQSAIVDRHHVVAAAQEITGEWHDLVE